MACSFTDVLFELDMRVASTVNTHPILVEMIEQSGLA